MIFIAENKSIIQAVFKPALPNLFVLIFFALQINTFSSDSSQNFNSFEDLASQELTLDKDDEEKDDGFVGLSFAYEYGLNDRYATIQLKSTSTYSFLQYSHQTRAPPQA